MLCLSYVLYSSLAYVIVLMLRSRDDKMARCPRQYVPSEEAVVNLAVKRHILVHESNIRYESQARQSIFKYIPWTQL
jgi:hypothetical protein